MISSLTLYQDNKVGDSNLMPVHSPLIFLIDVVYSETDPYYIYCKIYDGENLLNTFKCIPYKDLTTTKRRFMFIADSILRGYMESYDDFNQSESSIVEVEDITKEFTLSFEDPDGDADSVTLDIVALHGVSQFGEAPNKSDIYNNVNEDVYLVKDNPSYLYVYNTDGGEITIGASYKVKFVISDSGGFLSNATVTIGGQEKITNTSGEAIFYLQNGNYNYTVSKDTYISESNDITIQNGGLVIELTLDADTLYTVEFEVLDGTTPVENAKITVGGESPIYTDSLGIASIQLYSDTYNYEVDAGNDYQLINDSFILDYSNINVSVSLTEVTGYSCLFKTELRTGVAVSDVTVSIDGTTKTVTTDSSGEGTINDLLPGTYNYTATKPNYYVSIGTIVIENVNINETIIMNKG